MVLTATVFIPLLGSLAVMLLPKADKQLTRWVTTLFTAIPVLFALYMLGSWNSAPMGINFGGQVAAWSRSLKFVEHYAPRGASRTASRSTLLCS